MNFFAHSFVARRVRRDPAFLLGAMLPDFATMSVARLGVITHADLREGIAEHHRTDEAFHAGATFVALCQDVAARLEGRGLGWGSARAVAHVGTELLLDGELTFEVDACRDYGLAVAEAADARSGAHVIFRDTAGRRRFEELRDRLATHGTPVRYREPAFVSEVLVRILSGRARLAVPDALHDVVRDEMGLLAGRVREARDALVADTLVGLSRA